MKKAQFGQRDSERERRERDCKLKRANLCFVQHLCVSVCVCMSLCRRAVFSFLTAKGR